MVSPEIVVGSQLARRNVDGVVDVTVGKTESCGVAVAVTGEMAVGVDVLGVVVCIEATVGVDVEVC